MQARSITLKLALLGSASMHAVLAAQEGPLEGRPLSRDCFYDPKRHVRRLDTCKILSELEQGADPNAEVKTFCKRVPLAEVAISKDPEAPEMAKVLLDAKADVNQLSDKRAQNIHHTMPPLDFALQSGNEAVASLMLDHGADITHTREEIWRKQNLPVEKNHWRREATNTPLHEAIKFNMPPKFIQKMIEKGAPAGRKNEYGETPLHMFMTSFYRQHHVPEDAVETFKIVAKQLVEENKLVNQFTDQGESLVSTYAKHIHCDENDPNQLLLAELAEVIAESSAEIEHLDEKGEITQALGWATNYRMKLGAIPHLLYLGADPAADTKEIWRAATIDKNGNEVRPTEYDSLSAIERSIAPIGNDRFMKATSMLLEQVNMHFEKFHSYEWQQKWSSAKGKALYRMAMVPLEKRLFLKNDYGNARDYIRGEQYGWRRETIPGNILTKMDQVQEKLNLPKGISNWSLIFSYTADSLFAGKNGATPNFSPSGYDRLRIGTRVYRNHGDHSLLQKAILMCHEDLVRVILHHKNDHTLVTKFRDIPCLVMCAECKHTERHKKLTEKEKIDGEQLADTATIHAIQTNMARDLLAHGANVNDVAEYYRTQLAEDIGKSIQKSMRKFLSLYWNKSYNEIRFRNFTPLHGAVLSLNKDLCRLLIENKAFLGVRAELLDVSCGDTNASKFTPEFLLQLISGDTAISLEEWCQCDTAGNEI